MQQKIQNLIQRCVEGNATEEERQELSRLLMGLPHEEAVQLLQGSFGQVSRPADMNAETADSVLMAIVSVKEKKAPVLSLKRIAAAAAVLLILAASVFFLIQKPHADRNIVINEQQQDIHPPQKNLSTLTLSDGSEIILDKADAGSLAVQSGMKIVKQEDGSLSYVATGQAGEAAYNTLYNPPGSKPLALTLADGSVVLLNADSKLTFPAAFLAGERKVELQGEGFFEIVHNKEKPFIVAVNDMKVEVLGTTFNVNAYRDEGSIKTMLLSGSVKLTGPKTSMLLRPGEQASWKDEHFIRMERPDREVELAWKNGRFVFHGADITSVMRQLARWYNVEVVYADGLPKEEFVGVISRYVSLSEVLAMLEKTETVRFQTEGRKITVMPFKNK